jgi:6,7-dimethyl-8-ribityllumazine synthase
MGKFSYSEKIDEKRNKKLKIAIIISQWNKAITERLLKDTSKTLIQHGIKESNISKITVPGSFELIFAAKKIGKLKEIDAIIVIGCIIKGNTPHFEYISNSVSLGIKDLNILLEKPVIFGVLTTQNIEEAEKRSTGIKNKGREFAVSAIEMTKI